MPWAQGSVIAAEDMQALGLVEEGRWWGVVITHDCDLANDNLELEPAVEVIVAQTVSSPDGNHRYAKNARKLHLDWEGGVEPWCLELLATRRCHVDKATLAGFEPAPGATLSPAGRRILQSWLAARYRRQALPDSLVERLRKVFARLEKRGKGNAGSVVGYWLSFEPADELPPAEPYDLNISIVYTIEDPFAEDTAVGIAEDLAARFEGLVRQAGAGPVVLGECAARSEEEFTLKDIREHVEFRLDYLSNRVYPDGVELE
ncbi:hypothetical protein [Halomonas sp. PBN3]|uniref:hypothetical protein n=1 Tax=Halomonas sp. PBN3 TaxID=1397528 RepID=UPI0003B905A6|nr:hypothetical protein [Halomonas sp. PBN3]ERS87949.1 hypothetical protein Q671_08545 [Halomonas sp. PBN3]